MNTAQMFHRIDGNNWPCTAPRCEWCHQGDVPTTGRDRSTERVDQLLAGSGVGKMVVLSAEKTTMPDPAYAGSGITDVGGSHLPTLPPRPYARPPAKHPANPFVHPQVFASWEPHEGELKVRAGDEGLSLRDLAALHAMQGLVECRAYMVSGKEFDIARQAYKLADAMLAVREGGAS